MLRHEDPSCAYLNVRSIMLDIYKKHQNGLQIGPTVNRKVVPGKVKHSFEHRRLKAIKASL